MHYTLKNKGFLLASIVLQRTFNIHGTFPLDKMFFLLTKKKGSFKNASLKGSLGNQKWFFYGRHPQIWPTPAEFSSDPNQTHLRMLIRVVEIVRESQVGEFDQGWS